MVQVAERRQSASQTVRFTTLNNINSASPQHTYVTWSLVSAPPKARGLPKYRTTRHNGPS